MIAQTHPSERAVAALESRLGLEGVLWNEPELETVKSAIADLRQRISSTGLVETSLRPRINIEYRDHGDAARGRLYLEVIGLQQAHFLADQSLDALQVYLFLDGEQFAGLQVDAAKTLGTRLEQAMQRLDELNLPALDCEEANLQNTNLSAMLLWAWQQRVQLQR